MPLRRILTTPSCMVLALLMLTVYPVSAAVDTPQNAVKAFLETIQKIKKEKGLSPDEADLNHKLMNRAITYFDVTLVSQKTLGKHWGKQSPENQKAFVSRLGELFKFVAFPSSSKFFKDLKIQYQQGPEEGKSSNVEVSVQHPEEGEIKLDFIMGSQTGSWRVVDVILDGVSMRNNLRTQFRNVLKKKDFDALMTTMEKRIEKAKNE